MSWKPLPLLHNYIEMWAQQTPDNIAIIQHETSQEIDYKSFAAMIDLYALRLLEMGLRPGDRVATMLLNFPEHFFLMYACFKIGVIIAPIDVRLKEDEVVRDLAKIRPKAFFFLANTPARDFTQVGCAVRDNLSGVDHLVEFPLIKDSVSGRFLSFRELMNSDHLQKLAEKEELVELMKSFSSQLTSKSPCLIIYTTGTTGAPKPALLSHECIIAQNEILAKIIDLRGPELRLLCNMPPSHVAGTSEGPFTTFYVGGTAVFLQIFDPRKSLEAIEKHRVTCLGMIPTQYRMLWAVEDYAKYDLSSLKFALYAGAPGDIPFLTRLSQMAPRFGTGIGMTENAGFATGTPPEISVEEMAGQVGRCFPDVALVTVRAPMNEDGTAGEELPDGEIGEICYHPPLVFLGYFDQPEETAKTLSKESILYTGDMGYFKNMGSYRALYLTGRRKFMIKQKGYNVFPDEVQNHIATHPKVAMAEVVGVPHRLYDEGIMAFVQPKPGVELTVDELMDHLKSIASYKRPQHIEIMSPDAQFPLNRVGKVDKIELMKWGQAIAERLRNEGGWDAATSQGQD